ncbi:hypothetical protein B0H21DRAFT_495836 [Amylocystis lapponica]|nr:hypothetical protein B0H21DRAFT_495836 [Amylocystis lapponica]
MSRSSQSSESRSDRNTPRSLLSVDISLANAPLEHKKRAIDSAYYSSASTRNIGILFHDLLYEWKIADDAAQRLPAEEAALQQCTADLAKAQETLDQLQGQRPAQPGLKRRKSSFLDVFHKGARPDVAHSPAYPIVPDSSEELIAADRDVLRLEADVRNRTKQIEITKIAAANLDSSFDALKKALQTRSPRRQSSASGNENPITRAEKSVAAREEAYVGSQEVTQALRRARLAIQSAHYHYRRNMDLMDAVCSPKRSKLAAMMGDEQSREATYKEAANISQKAQVCFNEGVRALEPHMDMLQNTEAQLCQALRDVGLLQAVRMYELMYGGKALAFGITQQQHIMLQKQEGIFAWLTDLAVAVQNFTVHCETVERGARDKRDTARRHMVAMWMGDGPISLPPLSP